MHCVKKITQDMYWIGGNDRRLALFESAFPIPTGVSYNSYFVDDEKTIVFDTVDKAVGERFFENLDYLLAGRKLDYCVINHMEPDHCATVGELIKKYPDVKLVGNNKTFIMLKQFFNIESEANFITVKEGDTLNTGKHTYTFVMAPMVHWPEAMVSYDTVDKILYSADAFGTFGAINGNIFADLVNFREKYLDEARRYYTNIVGKYGTQVMSLLKKASTLDIQMICPLHGPVWREDIPWFIDKYIHWASYEAETEGVLIAYASVYGNTENAAEIIANNLSQLGVKNIAMYDVSVTHPSYILAEAFKYSHIVLASTTYNNGIFCNMETLLHDIAVHNLQNKTVALIENGTWSPNSGQLMENIFAKLKNMNILKNTVTIKSAVKERQGEELMTLAEKIVDTMPATINQDKPKTPSALFHISYGLYVVTSNDGTRANGAIINTLAQVTDNPKRISIAVNKGNYSHDVIKATGKFNVAILNQKATFDLFKRFGFQSGRDTDKFAGLENVAIAENGLPYITDVANAYVSGAVTSMVEFDTHTVFYADLVADVVLNDLPSLTYAYYHSDVKPKPQKQEATKKGFVCKICNYIYEGDTLPEDYVCPLCKHGAEDFEPLAATKKEEKKGYVCKICNYVYEGDTLPDDYVCPICKHGVADFEPLHKVEEKPAEPATEEKKGYVCKICKYVYEGDDMPDDYKCPICKKGKEFFEPIK